MRVFLPALLVALTACGPAATTPPPLSEEQKQAIIADLSSVNYPVPQSIEVNKETGFVVATFLVTPDQIPDGGKALATDTLLKIRERLLPSGSYKNFRVTLNAPSEYTGIVERYGSARLIEDQSSVDWQQGK